MSVNCRTNSNGECTLRNVSKGTHTLTASKNGYNTHTQEINVDDSQLDFNVIMEKSPEPGHTKNITFQLKNETGDNITDYDNDNLELVEYEHQEVAKYEGRIDSTGKATINDIEYGHYKISIPSIMLYEGFEEELIVNDDTPDNMDLTIMYKRAEIHCSVTQGDDAPCPGLTVEVWNENDTELITTSTTGSAGGCNIKNLIQGTYRIKVYDASLDVENNPYFYNEEINVISENINKNIKLENHYTVTFECGDLDNNSRVLSVEYNDIRYAKHLPTNEQAYTTTLILPNGTYNGEIIKDERYVDWTESFIVNGNNITINIHGYDVSINTFDDATGEKLGWSYISIHNGDWSVNHDGTTSDTGNITFEHIPRGTYTISATHDGYNNYTENDFIVNENILNKEIRLTPNQ